MRVVYTNAFRLGSSSRAFNPPIVSTSKFVDGFISIEWADVLFLSHFSIVSEKKLEAGRFDFNSLDIDWAIETQLVVAFLRAFYVRSLRWGSERYRLMLQVDFHRWRHNTTTRREESLFLSSFLFDRPRSRRRRRLPPRCRHSMREDSSSFLAVRHIYLISYRSLRLRRASLLVFPSPQTKLTWLFFKNIKFPSFSLNAFKKDAWWDARTRERERQWIFLGLMPAARVPVINYISSGIFNSIKLGKLKVTL